MKIKFFGHNCFFLEGERVSILTDPWLTDKGAFFGSWYQWPINHQYKSKLINLLKDIQKEYGLTYLFISHDLKVIRSMSDYIFVMKDGIIIESGISQKVFDEPKEEYTKKLLTAALRYASE